MLKRSGTVVTIVAFFGARVPDAIAQNKDRNLVVMTRNMDTGSDFKFVLSATNPLQLVLGVTLTYQEILASNIPERADGIAEEVQKQQPDLVALQEVTTLLRGPLGGPATTIVADQLPSWPNASGAASKETATISQKMGFTFLMGVTPLEKNTPTARVSRNNAWKKFRKVSHPKKSRTLTLQNALNLWPSLRRAGTPAVPGRYPNSSSVGYGGGVRKR